MKAELDRLSHQLSSSEPDTRQQAARKLAEMAAGEAYYALHYRRASEPDPATREVLQVSLQQLEARLIRLPIQATLPGLFASVRPVLANEQPDMAARAAALCTLNFIEALVTEKSLATPTTSTSAQEIVLPQSIPGLIYILQDSRKEWRRRAEGALILLGSDAVVPLCQAFTQATPLLKRRIVSVLSDINDVAALPTLWAAVGEGLEGDDGVSMKVVFLRMGVQLPEHPEKVPLKELLPVLAESKQHLPALAKQIAQALEHWAKTTPTPELRNALPLLKGTWLFPVPLELDSARQAIEAATAAWANLPIASDPSGAVSDSLPVPAESGASQEPPGNLPRPGKVA